MDLAGPACACDLLADVPPSDIVQRSSNQPDEAGFATGAAAPTSPRAPTPEAGRGAEGVSSTEEEANDGATVGVNVELIYDGARWAETGGDADESMLKRLAEDG